jgi:hypothetical protein
MRAVISPNGRAYPYAGTAYADPDAVTQIANGLSTTTFTYDNNGNVTQKTVDGTTTTYVYDYANRLTALGVLGATTTYAYDAFGQRVLQTGTTTTYLYPFKWYSVASSTGTGAKFATTTDYVFNGDSLVATVDQQTASGNATGTAKTRYIHPDHLGSTNVVTDENDNVVQTFNFAELNHITTASVPPNGCTHQQFVNGPTVGVPGVVDPNDFPLAFVQNAAFANLIEWVDSGGQREHPDFHHRNHRPPPHAAGIDIDFTKIPPLT